MHTALVYVRSILFLVVTLLALPVAANQSTLLIVGDSLSAAYGVPSETAWVQLLRNRLENNGLTDWEVVNASISGETTDGGARRLPGLLEENDPDVVIIELGGNDGLRGFPPNVIESNLASMIEKVQSSGARAVLVGMQIPPNYGRRYTAEFTASFSDIAAQSNTVLIPFLLEEVALQPQFMQADGIHPTAVAQPLIVDAVLPHLLPLVE